MSTEAPERRVTVYVGRGCHLCELGLDVVERVRLKVPFALEVIDVTDQPALEEAFRELLPVVEIDDVRAFHHFVPPVAFEARVAARGDGSSDGRETP